MVEVSLDREKTDSCQLAAQSYLFTFTRPSPSRLSCAGTSRRTVDIPAHTDRRAHGVAHVLRRPPRIDRTPLRRSHTVFGRAVRPGSSNDRRSRRCLHIPCKGEYTVPSAAYRPCVPSQSCRRCIPRRFARSENRRRYSLSIPVSAFAYLDAWCSPFTSSDQSWALCDE
jgi:hypothetical protein